MAKKTGASWFKVFSNSQPLFNALPNEAVGKALKLSLQYFSAGVIPTINDELTQAAFDVLKASADEAIADYKRSVEAGRKGADAKKQKQTAPRSPFKPPLGMLTEAEAEAETENKSLQKKYIKGEYDD